MNLSHIFSKGHLRALLVFTISFVIVLSGSKSAHAELTKPNPFEQKKSSDLFSPDSNPISTYTGKDFNAQIVESTKIAESTIIAQDCLTTPTKAGCPTNTSATEVPTDINEEFRKNAKKQIDTTLDLLRPSNAPDLLPGSFKQQVKDDKTNAGIPALLSYVAGIIASIAGLVAMINILYNSYVYISSKGDTVKTGKAQKGITWSLIGLVGIIFSYNIVYSVIRLVYEQAKNGGL